MKIASINNYSVTNFGADDVDKKAAKEAKKLKQKQDEEKAIDDFKKLMKDGGLDLDKKVSPLTAGLVSGAGWFAIGYVIERALGRMIKTFKTPRKTSLIMNLSIGAALGSYTAYKVSKSNKEAAQSQKTN